TGYAGGDVVTGREKLTIVEDDNLRPLLVDEIALEIRGNVDRGDRFAGPYGLHRTCERVRTVRNSCRWRGCDRLNIKPGRWRPICIDNARVEVADHGVAERQS